MTSRRGVTHQESRNAETNRDGYVHADREDPAQSVEKKLEAGRKAVRALIEFMRLRNTIEVMGEWSACDTNRGSYDRASKRVDAAMADARAALEAAEAAGLEPPKKETAT